MRRDPRIIDIEEAVRQARENTTLITDVNGKERWVPARGLGYATIRDRLRYAWLVFTGKADALIYPGQ